MYECQNCSTIHTKENLNPIKDAHLRVDDGNTCEGECPNCGALVGDEIKLILGMWKVSLYDESVHAAYAEDGIMFIDSIPDVNDIDDINKRLRPVMDVTCYFHKEDEVEVIIYAEDTVEGAMTHLWVQNCKGVFERINLNDDVDEDSLEEFEVTVYQTMHKQHTFKVKASDRKNAETHAVETLALEHDWSQHSIDSCDYEV